MSDTEIERARCMELLVLGMSGGMEGVKAALFAIQSGWTAAQLKLKHPNLGAH